MLRELASKATQAALENAVHDRDEDNASDSDDSDCSDVHDESREERSARNTVAPTYAAPNPPGPVFRPPPQEIAEGPVPGFAVIAAGFNIVEMRGRKGKLFSFSTPTTACGPSWAKWLTSSELQYHGHSERELFIQEDEETISAERTVSGSLSVHCLAVASLRSTTSSAITSKRSFTSKKVVYVDLQYTHDLNLAPSTVQLAQMLDPDFLSHVRALPAVYSADTYREFIDAFGTHFVRRLQLGGAKHMTMTFESEEDIDERSITNEISGSYGIGSSVVGVGVSSRSALSSAKSSTQLNVAGGDVTAPSDAEWRDSLFLCEPHAFPSSLASLAVFLPAPQNQHFERAVKEFALEHHLQKSKANTIAGEKDGDQWVLGKEYHNLPGKKITNIRFGIEEKYIRGIQLVYNYSEQTARVGQSKKWTECNIGAHEYVTGFLVCLNESSRASRGLTGVEVRIYNVITKQMRKEFFGEDKSNNEDDVMPLQAGEGYEVKGLYGYVTSKITGIGAFVGVHDHNVPPTAALPAVRVTTDSPRRAPNLLRLAVGDLLLVADKIEYQPSRCPSGHLMMPRPKVTEGKCDVCYVFNKKLIVHECAKCEYFVCEFCWSTPMSFAWRPFDGSAGMFAPTTAEAYTPPTATPAQSVVLRSSASSSTALRSASPVKPLPTPPARNSGGHGNTPSPTTPAAVAVATVAPAVAPTPEVAKTPAQPTSASVAKVAVLPALGAVTKAPVMPASPPPVAIMSAAWQAAPAPVAKAVVLPILAQPTQPPPPVPPRMPTSAPAPPPASAVAQSAPAPAPRPLAIMAKSVRSLRSELDDMVGKLRAPKNEDLAALPPPPSAPHTPPQAPQMPPLSSMPKNPPPMPLTPPPPPASVVTPQSVLATAPMRASASASVGFDLVHFIRGAGIKEDRVAVYAKLLADQEFEEDGLEMLDDGVLASWGITVGMDRLRIVKAAKAHTKEAEAR